MRTPHFLPVLLLAVFCFLPSSSFAQAPKRSGIKEYSPAQASRKADSAEDKRSLAKGNAGKLRSYDHADEIAAQKPPSDPYTILYGVLLALFIGMCCAPVMFKLQRDNKKRLADEASFGRNGEGSGDAAAASGRDGPSDGLAVLDDAGERHPSVPRVSADELRERVWNTLIDAQKWLSAEGVARLAKLDPDQARGELQDLARDGHIEQSKDRTGRPIYKMPA